MTSPYETLYGMGLLDDLHNYFPALLYQPERFLNVQQVLHYIQEQTRNRFDLFSLGQREYRGANHSVHLNTTTSDISGGAAIPNSNLLNRVPPNPTGNTISYMFNLNPDQEEEEIALTTQLVRTLLTLPLTTHGRVSGGDMDAFLQPIVIHPTAEQITANTTVGNLVSNTEYTCAVCQDVLQADQEGRKLNTCGHWFHKNCIDTWLGRNVHCPVCRHDIRESTATSEPQ